MSSRAAGLSFAGMIDSTQHPLAASAAPSLIAFVALGAVLMGLDGLILIPTHQSADFTGTTSDYIVESIFGAGLLAGLATPLELARRAGGRAASAAAWLSALGQACVATSVLVTVIGGRDVLDTLYLVGTVAWIAGLVALAIAAPRVRATALITIPAVVVALALFGGGGPLALALAWGAVAARRSLP
jgi:hypothetical protein